MSVKAMDKRITVSMFVKNLGQKLQGVMAKSIPPQEKLNFFIEEMEKDAQEKRGTARSIRAKMVALSDPDTKELEPLERMKVQRERLVKAGKEAFSANDTEKVNRVAAEIKSLDTPLVSMERTYETLKDAYEVAIASYRTASGALEHTKNNGNAMLLAIEAQQEALSMRDSARGNNKTADTSFLNDLEKELQQASGEYRADKEIEGVLDTPTISQEIDNSEIVNEFK